MIESTFSERSKLALITLSVGLNFVVLFTRLPIVTIQPTYDGLFPYVIGIVFIAGLIGGAVTKLKYVLPVIVLVAFVFPLTKVTASARFNVDPTGLLFGAVSQLRYSKLNYRREHLYLAGMILGIGAYYNLFPLFTGGSDTFNAKLWVFNLATFGKYVLVIALVTQANIEPGRILRAVNWFAFAYALFVVIDAFHIPAINWAMKSFTFFAQGSGPEYVEYKALHYFRSSGLAIDSIHAGTKLSFLLAVALYQYRSFRWSWLLIPTLVFAIFLTGSRSATVLTIVGFAAWVLYFRNYSYQFESLVRYALVFAALTTICLANDSFATVFKISFDRNITVLTERTFNTDESFLYRANEIVTADLSVFGDKDDHLLGVHSGVVMTARLYGYAGLVLLIIFWNAYLVLARKSFLSIALVSMLGLSTFYLWSFHIEAFFIPVTFITALMIRTPSARQEYVY